MQDVLPAGAMTLVWEVGPTVLMMKQLVDSDECFHEVDTHLFAWVLFPQLLTMKPGVVPFHSVLALTMDIVSHPTVDTERMMLTLIKVPPLSVIHSYPNWMKRRFVEGVVLSTHVGHIQDGFPPVISVSSYDAPRLQ